MRASNHNNPRNNYLGKRVRARKGTPTEAEVGVVFKVTHCTLDGCGGVRLHVAWPNGVHTYPCAQVCMELEDGSLEIK